MSSNSEPDKDPTFADYREDHETKTQESIKPKGSSYVAPTPPDYGWELCGHMEQDPGTEYPALSTSDLRYPECGIEDGSEYFDPIQGLPPRAIILGKRK